MPIKPAKTEQGESRSPYMVWGWAGSLVVHVSILCIALFFSGAYGVPGGMGQDVEEYHTVGLYSSSGPGGTGDGRPFSESPGPGPEPTMEKVQPDPPAFVEPQETEPEPTDTQIAMDQVDPSTIAKPLPDEPSESMSEQIGAGMSTSTSPSAAMPEVATIVPGGGTGVGSPAPPAGTINFFNIADTGKSFVFVIDMSQSMIDDNAFDAAREQLLAGLSNLKIEQKFQVVFYNGQVHEFRLQDRAAELVLASPVHLTLARNFITAQLPSGGTSHQPALMTALKYRPDVIFFLTDALEPKLEASQLERLRSYNRGAKIHTIEFGSGPDLDRGLNFLERLASQNNGTHRYVDVKQFNHFE